MLHPIEGVGELMVPLCMKNDLWQMALQRITEPQDG